MNVGGGITPEEGSANTAGAQPQRGKTAPRRQPRSTSVNAARCSLLTGREGKKKQLELKGAAASESADAGKPAAS